MMSNKHLLLHTKQESRLREVCFFIEGENLVSLYSKQLVEMSSPLETDCVCVCVLCTHWNKQEIALFILH